MEPTANNDRFPYRLFFLLFTSVALLILAGAWYVGNERIGNELDLTRSNEIGTVVMGVRRLDDDLHAPFQQLRPLLADPAVRQGVERGDGQALAAAFATLIGYNETIDHIRWIDENGMERARVNNVDGRALVVPAGELQDKSDSYYFHASMRLKPGQV